MEHMHTIKILKLVYVTKYLKQFQLHTLIHKHTCLYEISTPIIILNTHTK